MKEIILKPEQSGFRSGHPVKLFCWAYPVNGTVELRRRKWLLLCFWTSSELLKLWSLLLLKLRRMGVASTELERFSSYLCSRIQSWNSMMLCHLMAYHKWRWGLFYLFYFRENVSFDSMKYKCLINIMVLMNNWRWQFIWVVLAARVLIRMRLERISLLAGYG